MAIFDPISTLSSSDSSQLFARFCYTLGIARGADEYSLKQHMPWFILKLFPERNEISSITTEKLVWHNEDVWDRTDLTFDKKKLVYSPDTKLTFFLTLMSAGICELCLLLFCLLFLPEQDHIDNRECQMSREKICHWADKKPKCLLGRAKHTVSLFIS